MEVSRHQLIQTEYGVHSASYPTGTGHKVAETSRWPLTSI